MSARPARRAAAGFTLIEMMCAVTVAGILSSIAYPGYQSVMHKTRRTDAQVALMQLQMAQERYRAEHASYGSLADLGASASSPQRHYTLAVSSSAADGFELQASAQGAQQSDTNCRHMKLAMSGHNIAYASGPDTRFANDRAANRQCWGF